MRALFDAIGILLLALALAGCSLPSGTRKITAWGVGVIPMGGIPFPFVGYWSSVHGDDTEEYNPAKPPALGASKP